MNYFFNSLWLEEVEAQKVDDDDGSCEGSLVGIFRHFLLLEFLLEIVVCFKCLIDVTLIEFQERLIEGIVLDLQLLSKGV